MAIDSLNKKLALIEYMQVYQPGIPVSADGLDQADNQQLLWGYPGILWGAGYWISLDGITFLAEV